MKPSFAHLSSTPLLALATAAHAAPPPTSVSWVEPFAVVGAQDTIPVWLRLRVDPGAMVPLVLDGTPSAFDVATDVPGFARIDHVDTQAWLACENSFLPGSCDASAAPYRFEYNSGADSFGVFVGGHALPLNLTLQPGESRDFLVGRFVPRSGAVPDGRYELTNAGLQLFLTGVDDGGNPAYTYFGLGAACDGGTGCALFTREVTAVPEVTSALTMLVGLAGVAGFVRGRHRQ